MIKDDCIRRLSIVLFVLLAFWGMIQVIESAYEFGMRVSRDYFYDDEYINFLEYKKSQIEIVK